MFHETREDVDYTAFRKEKWKSAKKINKAKIVESIEGWLEKREEGRVLVRMEDEDVVFKIRKGGRNQLS